MATCSCTSAVGERARGGSERGVRLAATLWSCWRNAATSAWAASASLRYSAASAAKSSSNDPVPPPNDTCNHSRDLSIAGMYIQSRQRLTRTSGSSLIASETPAWSICSDCRTASDTAAALPEPAAIAIASACSTCSSAPLGSRIRPVFHYKFNILQ